MGWMCFWHIRTMQYYRANEHGCRVPCFAVHISAIIAVLSLNRFNGMKVVCAWCKKVIRDSPEEIVSHGICETCEKRMARDIIGRPPGNFSDWSTFVERQLLCALVCFTFVFLVILAAEGLHSLTGGKVPQLIEWQPRQLQHHVQKKFPR